MSEVMIIGGTIEGKEIIIFIDVLTDRSEITGVMIRAHRIIIMIHIGGVIMAIMIRAVQMDLLYILTPTVLENLSGGVVATLKLYKKKAVPKSL